MLNTHRKKTSWIKQLGVIVPLLGLGFLVTGDHSQAGEEKVYNQFVHESSPVKSKRITALNSIFEKFYLEDLKSSLEEVTEADVELETSEEYVKKYFSLIIRGNKTSNDKVDLMREIMEELPSEHISRPKKVVLRYDDPEAPRGLGGSKTIILRAVNVDDDEFVSLFIHELGHTVDLGLLQGNKEDETEFYDGSEPIYAEDPSLDFYRICWKESENSNGKCADKDFVTGYAQTDVFEDFAESYLFYVLHGTEFRAMAQKSDILKQKYSFFLDIFDGREFETGTLTNVSSSRSWDATLLPLGKTLIAFPEN